MNDKVMMRSPEGEIREVEANGPELVPLMVKGWHQAPSKKTDAPVAVLEPAKPVTSDLIGKK